MKYYIIAGEASGDIHGSNLITALLQKDQTADIRAWGGDLMEAAGAEVVKHYRDLAFMGFLEVVKNLPTILNNFKFCKKDVLSFQPDVLILIDYPGFNLRIAKWAKRKGIRVFYYISPQIWAWNSKRVHQIKRDVDQMFVILPFEKDFYKQYNYEVDFVGHPLLDHLDQQHDYPDFRTKNELTNQSIIALLPGSRRQEISRMLEVMLTITPQFPDYQFVIGGAPALPANFYNSLLNKFNAVDQKNLKIVYGQTYPLLKNAKAALVTSGTATLETALIGTPQVVCYKGNNLSYLLARQLVNVKYISLVNLILDKPLVRELIQKDYNSQQLKHALEEILVDQKVNLLKNGYEELKLQLGSKGASALTAELVISYLRDHQ